MLENGALKALNVLGEQFRSEVDRGEFRPIIEGIDELSPTNHNRRKRNTSS